MDLFANKLKREGSIEDNFHLEETIGEQTFIKCRGGTSVVKKGIRKSDGQVFAIKIIDKEHLNDDELNCLKNELRILGLVNHPNIVRVYEYYETYECIFIVMEVMVGGEVYIT